MRLEQHRKLLAVMCDDDHLVVYEWSERKVVEEITVEEMSAMSSEESSVVVGTKEGCL